MKIRIIEPDAHTHIQWVKSQPPRLDPDDWESPQIPVAIAEGVSATWKAPLAKATGAPQTLEFLLSLSRDIGVAVLAHVIVEWIIANFAGHAEKVVVERTVVSFERGEITKVVTEKIRLE